jgi:threonine dehydratase
MADGVRVKQAGLLTRDILGRLLDDIVIVREAELRETVVRLALEEHLIAEGAGALALAAGRRVAGKRKCAVLSGGNIDASMLAGLLADVRPRPPRKPRRRGKDDTLSTASAVSAAASVNATAFAAVAAVSPAAVSAAAASPQRATAAARRKPPAEVAALLSPVAPAVTPAASAAHAEEYV